MNKYIFLFSFVFAFFNLNAQPDLNFIRYTTQQGLSNNDVLYIHQDNFGFLWFGTKRGCSRFDGIEFKNYQYNENDPGSVGLGWVNQIISDNKSRLWFAVAGEGSTFMRYDYETDGFVDITPTINNQLNITDKPLSIWNVFPDSKGNVWLSGPNSGFMYYNPENRKVKIFDNQYIKGIDIFNIRDFFEDVNENIWFATTAGVFIYNRQKDSFKNYRHEPENALSLSSDNCNRIFQDSKEQIWICTHNGLNKLVSGLLYDSLVFKRFTHDPKNPFTLSNNLLYDVAEDNNNNLLIATVNGLCLMDKKSGKTYRYFNNEIDNESINSNLVRSVYKDNQNNIWIGTNSGVGKLQVKNFKSFSQSFYKNSISHNKVQYLYEAPNSDIWIATPRGIDVFNKKNGKFKFLTGVTQNEKGLYGSPIVFYPNKNEGMWIGTWNGGLSSLNYASNKVTNYITNAATQSMSDIFSILRDDKNNLWIGVYEKGIYAYDKDFKNYTVFSHNKANDNTLSSNQVVIIIEDSESNIWVGTRSGLNRLLDFKAKTFKRYFNDIEIKHIIEGSDKNLWIGTEKGLIKFNRTTGDFRKFDVSDGLPGNTIFSILEDSSQNLWVSTNNGLARFRALNDSVPKIIVYHQEEGLAIGEFLERSCLKLSDGAMLYGGTEGFCMFHPENIKIDTLLPKIVFTNLKIGNEIVSINQEINGQKVLEKSMLTTKQLALNHKNNTFTIEFAGLQYNMSQYNQYCYKLEGYDPKNSEWYYTGTNKRQAEYMNLPNGNYIFKVKAANSHGIWNNEPAELKITVLPLWWQTGWFMSSMAILLIIIIVVIVRIRTYNLQKQKQKLEKIVAQRTTELKEMNVILKEGKEELEVQMEQLAKMNERLEIKTTQVENMAKQLHEADQSKLRFFANISHEFRTPLSLIISPLEKCLNIEEPVDWKNVKNNYLQLIYKNSKRLLRLINQVIDFRKMEQGEKKLNISNNNIIEFANEVINAFSAQAEQKNISLVVESQYPTIDFRFDPDVMEKVFYNLISNAIKYTQEEGKVSVQLTVTSEQSTKNSEQSYDSPLNTDNCLLITVKDTGIGIKKENLDKIFDRFYREETNENYAKEGAGIGLAYTKELVELHKGIISVESERGKGTIFTLLFPMSKENVEQMRVNEESVSVNLDYIRTMVDSSEYKDETQNFSSDEKLQQDEASENKKPTILIVEDNVDLRKFIKNELDDNYYIHEAENGEVGLKLAIQHNPDIVISDIMMPVMDGIELCKKLKTNEDTSHIPIILLTAKGGEENMIKGLETGANDYITKPFDINILTIKINNLFQLKRQMQEKFSKSIDVIPSEVTHSFVDEEFMRKAIGVINENMHDYEFDNDAFIDVMGYSRSVIYRKVKAIADQSVGEFIRSVRLKAAAQLFLKGNDNVSEVCYRVGFKFPNIFAAHFKEMFGKTPTQFIKSQLKK